MKLMPPKLMPIRTSSGPDPLEGEAANPAGIKRPRASETETSREKGRMVEEEYAGLLPEGQEREKVVLAGGPKGTWIAPSWLVGLGAILVLFAACVAGEEDPPPPPEALLGLLETPEVQVVSSAPGLAYYGLRSANQPWAVHLLRVELNRCELGFKVMEAPVPEGEGRGRSLVTELLAFQGEGTLAGVNGDFFTPEGLPVGTEVVSGTTRRIRNRPAFAWHPLADPWMGTPSLEGDSVLVLGWHLPSSRSDGETEVIGGFPLLLQDGLRVGDLEVSELPSFAAERHPRTAVGFDRDEGLLWVVVVDGRQPGYSVGMTLPELAGLFEALGAEEAINLDGGGSSVMVVDGTTVSRPSDAEGERPVANALGIRRDQALCRSNY